MGNLECGESRKDAQVFVSYEAEKLKPPGPIRIQVEDDGIDPLVTTFRRPEGFLQRVLKTTNQKKKKTEKEMKDFIDDLIDRGKQSTKQLESKRKEKLIAQTRRVDTKHLSFDLDKFLTSQQQFLEKRNLSLQRSRQDLYASRAAEETHQPKINQNSRRIAIQVSGRNIPNKKVIVLRDSKKAVNGPHRGLQQDSPVRTRQRITTQSKQSLSASSKKQNTNRRNNEVYLRQKLTREFEMASLKLGVGNRVNYLEFTELLRSMNFASQESRERAMLLDAWNLLAGNQITVERGLALSFVLSLFGIELQAGGRLQQHVADLDSPCKLKQDLDGTFLTINNERYQTEHPGRLNSSLVEHIHHQYRLLCHNKMHGRSSSPRDSRRIQNQAGKREQLSPQKPLGRNTQNLSSKYKNKILDKAKHMHILQPRLFNKDLSLYQMGKIKQAIVDKQAQQAQLSKQVNCLRECTFQPQINPSNNSKGRMVFEMLYQDSKNKSKPVLFAGPAPSNGVEKHKCQQAPILHVQVNIGSRVQKIIVFEGDDVHQLAEDFLQRNSLSFGYKDKLLAMIEEGIRES